MAKFEKGHIHFNKGVKMTEYLSEAKIEKTKATRFKEDVIGKDHISWKGGVQIMTKDCAHVWTGKNQRERRPKAVYESVHGKILKGFVIYHIDKNKDNDAIDNLEAISRAELIKRNNPKLF